jgi:hypothetical protein
MRLFTRRRAPHGTMQPEPTIHELRLELGFARKRAASLEREVARIRRTALEMSESHAASIEARAAVTKRADALEKRLNGVVQAWETLGAFLSGDHGDDRGVRLADFVAAAAALHVLEAEVGHGAISTLARLAPDLPFAWKPEDDGGGADIPMPEDAALAKARQRLDEDAIGDARERLGLTRVP